MWRRTHHSRVPREVVDSWLREDFDKWAARNPEQARAWFNHFINPQHLPGQYIERTLVDKDD